MINKAWVNGKHGLLIFHSMPASKRGAQSKTHTKNQTFSLKNPRKLKRYISIGWIMACRHWNNNREWSAMFIMQLSGSQGLTYLSGKRSCMHTESRNLITDIWGISLSDSRPIHLQRIWYRELVWNRGSCWDGCYITGVMFFKSRRFYT